MDKTMIKYFFDIDNSRKNKIILYYIIQLFLVVTGIVTVLITGHFIDYLVDADLKMIIRTIAAFAVLCITELIVGYIKERFYMKLQMHLGNRGGLDIIYHLNNTSEYVHENTDNAGTVQKINNDINAIVLFGLNSLSELINAVFIFIVSAVILISLYPLCFLSIGVVFLVYMIFYIIMKNRYYKMEYAFKEKQIEYFSRLFEQLSKSRFMFILGISSFFRNRINQSYKNLEKSALSLQKISYLFTGVSGIIKVIGTLVLYAMCGYAVYKSKISVGEFSIIIAIFDYIMQSCVKLFDYAKEYQNTMVSYNRIKELKSIETIKNGIQKPEIKINSININSLSVFFDEKKVIDNFSYSFEKNNIYCITGRNGAGKSTLIQCILGIYPDNMIGNIFFNDIDLKTIDMSFFRGNYINYIEQKPTIINSSIKENILLEDTENNEVPDVLIDVVNFKEYYAENSDRIVTDEGASMSGGEKQKTEIIRGLINNKDILILDEPTSALDACSTEKLFEYLTLLKKNMIIIIISHDAKIIEKSDKVIRIDEFDQ